LLTLHNFSSRAQTVKLKVGCARDELLVEVFNGHHSRAQNDGAHHIRMAMYGWR